MKSRLLSTFILLNLLGGGHLALAQQPVGSPPTASASLRPLPRYLAATLHLTPPQAAAVQQALRANATYPLAPDALATYLEPVLSPEAQERLYLLRRDATTYRALCCLAARH